jgi:hypothetical protein
LERKILRRLLQTIKGINLTSAERNKFGTVCAVVYGVNHFKLFNYMQVCGLKNLPNLKESMSDHCKSFGPNEKENENSGT